MKARKLIILAMVCTVCAVTVAGLAPSPGSGKPVPGKPVPLEMRRELARKRMMERTGGWVRNPDSGSGRCVFMNSQGRLAKAGFAGVASEIGMLLRCTIDVEDGNEKITVTNATDILTKSGAQAAIFIVDDTSFPTTLLVAPEANWAFVNIAALATDKPADEVLARRARIELWRACAHLLGAADSDSVNCIMHTVKSVKDLDDMKGERFCPEPLSKMSVHLSEIGIKPYQVTTFKQACILGWSVFPTNQYQQAIWEQVKADKERGPTNPITIPPPNQKK